MPPSTTPSDADQVLEAPATCSTLGLYPVASAFQVNKAPLPVTNEFLTAPTSVQFSFSELVAPVGMLMTVPALAFESSTAFELPTAPAAIDSRMRPDHNNGGEDPTAVSLTPCSAPLSIIAPLGNSPRPQSAPWDVLELARRPPTTC